MKKLNKLTCLMVAAFLLLGISAEAQFFKKLTKKVTDKVERAVTDNISDKAANEADDALNNVWEMDLGKSGLGMGSPVDPSEIPDSYAFDWKVNYAMEMKSGKMDFVYRLKEGADYMGMAMPKMANMFIVMDQKNDLSIIYMNNKLMRATKINEEAISEAAKKESSYAKDMEYEKIGSKTISGYECEGYRAENEDYVFTIYITDDAGIGFSNFYENQKNLPESFNPDWISEDSLLMEMQMTDKKDADKGMTMTCTGIEKENFVIKK